VRGVALRLEMSDRDRRHASRRQGCRQGKSLNLSRLAFGQHDCSLPSLIGQKRCPRRVRLALVRDMRQKGWHVSFVRRTQSTVFAGSVAGRTHRKCLGSGMSSTDCEIFH
jgi:hypothetical protein